MGNGKKIFGTDGIRGAANGEWMNPLFFNKFAIAINKVIFGNNLKKKARIVIAKDTRRSGYMIESALSSAFMALGIHVVLVGPIPTAAVPFLMKYKKANLGFNISASHNPFNDNGIKIFDQNGHKLSDEVEEKIEQILLDDSEFRYERLAYSFIDSKKIGYLSRIHNTCELYVEHILKIVDHKIIDLSGLKIVVDCAHGAAYKLTEMFFKALQVGEVIVINNKPDGFNINNHCGAIHPESLCVAVIKHGAHLGIALDGDADRMVMCDERGRMIDNDQVLALSARLYKQAGLLKNNTVVINITSNSGIEEYLKKYDIDVMRVPVGDKYISDAFLTYGYNFGGEKSGHIIFGDYVNVGDGLLSSALICSMIKKYWQDNFYFNQSNLDTIENASNLQDFKISEIFNEVKLFFQLTYNFQYNKSDLADQILSHPDTINKLNTFQQNLNNMPGGGRILVRKSGTEPKIRLMAEGSDDQYIQNILNDILDFFTQLHDKLIHS